MGRSSASTDGFPHEPTYVAIFTLFAAIVGSVSFWGSNIAFAKLQELLPGRPITLGPLSSSSTCAAARRGRLRRVLIVARRREPRS